jgi:hypothetical protein
MHAIAYAVCCLFACSTSRLWEILVVFSKQTWMVITNTYVHVGPFTNLDGVGHQN